MIDCGDFEAGLDAFCPGIDKTKLWASSALLVFVRFYVHMNIAMFILSFIGLNNQLLVGAHSLQNPMISTICSLSEVCQLLPWLLLPIHPVSSKRPSAP